MKQQDHICPECGCIISADIFSADKMRQRFFAIVKDVHRNLAGDLLTRFPNSEYLRKYALIAVGWCTVHTIVGMSEKTAAATTAAILFQNPYCIITFNEGVMTIYSAKSMSRRALLKKQFLDVSEKALEWIEQQTGIDGRLSEAA